MKTYKAAGRLTDQGDVLDRVADEAVFLIGHLRWATHGSTGDNINNHPHPCDGGWIAHNGVVGNYTQLIHDYDLLPNSKCDSEVIGLAIEEAVDSSLLMRVAQTINAVDDGSALAMTGLWNNPDPTLLIARRGNPLSVSRTRHGMYFASLPTGLPGQPVSVLDDYAYLIGADGMMGESCSLQPREAQLSLPYRQRDHAGRVLATKD